MRRPLQTENEGESMDRVFIELCENYRIDRVTSALEKIFEGMGGIGSIVKPGMRVAIKPNLLMPKKPDDAATTHPAVVQAIAGLVQKAGGLVSIVESPGGPYNVSSLKRIYTATGMEEAADETGAQLNFDLRVERIDNPDALIIKSLKILKPLRDADLIINVAKLKTHRLMVYTGAVKNMFGAIPGLEKADYHLRLDQYDKFADCLIDIYLATRPQINIIDSIIGMEGEGPGSGVPKYLGVLIGSKNGFAADLAALSLINVDYRQVPVLKRAEERKLIQPEQVIFEGVDIATVRCEDFDVPALVSPSGMRLSGRLLSAVEKIFRPKPEIRHEKCISCGKCAEVCPPKTIRKGDDKKMIIDYSKCISCFCCHEFCPEKAVRIRKNIARRILEYRRTSGGEG